MEPKHETPDPTSVRAGDPPYGTLHDPELDKLPFKMGPPPDMDAPPECEPASATGVVFGVFSCLFFGATALCGLGMVFLFATWPAPNRAGELRALNQILWNLGLFLVAAVGILLSVIGFCSGFLGLVPRGKKRTAAIVGSIFNAVSALIIVALALWILVLRTGRP
jgi:hypothetical protein